MKEYKKSEDLTVQWKPELCMHSEKCWRGLPNVFQPKSKPWIKVEAASEELIKKQIDQCPSGALSYTLSNAQSNESMGVTVEIMKNGPIIINENVQLKHAGNPIEQRNKLALCRCGASKNKPYCDGTHKKISFSDEP